MKAILASAFVLFVLDGCEGPRFTHLGNGTAVPSKYFDEFAQENDLTREQAREAIIAESAKRRIGRE